YYQTGNYAKAIEVFREALEMRRALFPKANYPNGHPDLATSINNLGMLHWAAGEYGKAEPLYREALEMYRALYPKARSLDGPPALARSLNTLGLLHHSAGEYGKAEPLYREALEIRRALLHRYADLAAEAESLNYVATQPRSRDALLSVTR